MDTMKPLLILAALLAGAPVAAESRCYTGRADSGELTFSAAVEETGFAGRFAGFDVEYCMPEGAPEDGRIVVGVAPGTADTGNRDRDEALLGPEFFAVEAHPRARWQSTGIARAGDGYRAQGELTLKGVTRSQPLRFTLMPDGAELVTRGTFSLSGTAEVDRQRFRVGTGEFADPEFVRDHVDVAFEVRLRARD